MLKSAGVSSSLDRQLGEEDLKALLDEGFTSLEALRDQPGPESFSFLKKPVGGRLYKALTEGMCIFKKKLC